MANKLNLLLSFIIAIIISFCCGVYFSEDIKSDLHLANGKTLAYEGIESTTVETGQTVASINEQTVDAENEPSNGDDEESEATSGAENQSGNEQAIDEPEVTRVTAENRFSDPRDFKYGVNSVNGITLTWFVNNLTGKTINYYTVKLSTFNPVGDPSYDENSSDSTFNLRYVGPVEPGEEFGVFKLFTYQGALDSIRIDEVVLEYADDTEETVVYNRTTADNSGLNN
ncbi:hypothetical protein [Paenibacillus sp. JDR-2]|uniref:hypothetical protein n=1 Tax=Paenibacillus sp. (strain JDR-2) TaxID=324057 RepID=UPI0001665C6F|nr:hypothetical protein [Paenibacillus sp. JDR-2]ACT03197.1 hypothetical protein Pjdr2_4582 [Paenibacillus sp. JDR-2]